MDNINDNIHLISVFILSLLLIIVIIYFYKNIMQKHCDIIDKFSEEQDEAIINDKNNYGNGHTSGSESLDKKTINGNITLRPCQLYFVGEEQQESCDNDKNNKTCKYEFTQNPDDPDDINNWKEIDTIETDGVVNTYPKKIYNQTYTKTNITNHDEMAQCFKRFNNANDIKYIYKQNDLISYNYGGQTHGDTMELKYRNNTDDDYTISNFISMKFGNTDNASVNYSNAIGSICSLQRNKISSLNNITKNSYNTFFYRFAIDSNNTLKSIVLNGKRVLDIKIVELNNAQTEFIDRGIADFPNKNLIGIDYSEIIDDKIYFNVYKNIKQPTIACKIYKFKYNHLCDNGILRYLYPYETNMNITSFIETSGNDNIDAKKRWDITNKAALSKAKMAKYSRKNPRTDQKDTFVSDLKEILSQKLINYTGFTELDAQINALNIKKNTWIVSRTAAETSKSNFHTGLTFEKLMVLRKPDFVNPITQQTIYNSSVRVFNYRRGYQISKENPDAPYDPAKKYGNMGVLNDNLVQYELASNVLYWGSGLSGRRHNQKYLQRWSRWWYRWRYYYNDNNLNHFRRTRATHHYSGKNDFMNLRAHRGEKYGYYWKSKFIVRVTGHYHFATWSDDGSHVWVNNAHVVNNGGLHGNRGRSGYAGYFKKGEIKTIEISFAENYGGDELKFGWHSPQVGPGWYHTADKKVPGGKVEKWFYQEIRGQDGGALKVTPMWDFYEGAYYANIEADGTGREILFDAIYINNKKVNGIQQIPSGTIANPDRWHPITYEDNTVEADTDYIFYFKEATPDERKVRIELKAIDKPKTLEAKVGIVMGGKEKPDNAQELAENNWITVSSDETWDTDNNIQTTVEEVSLEPYKLSKVSFKGYIFLQKGKYVFNINLGLPNNLTIESSQLTLDDTISIKENVKYIFDSYDSETVITAKKERVNQQLEKFVVGTDSVTGKPSDEVRDPNPGRARESKFYKYNAQYYVLNNTKSNVNISFNFNVNYESIDGSIIKNNQSLNNLSYSGTQIYQDNKKTNFWNKFSKITPFQKNTSDDFTELKEFLTPLSGRGKDFWNLILIQNKIDDIISEISSQLELLESEKQKLKDKYNYIIDGIEKLDYKKKFLNNKTYFDNPEIVFKQNVSISNIFTNSDKLDDDNQISNYITYEKIKDISLRTPLTKNDINFDVTNNSDRFIYVLKDSIDVKDAVKASF